MNPPCFTPAAPAHNAVEKALMQSALVNSAGSGSDFQDEITRRLNWICGATDFLVEMIAEADLRSFDLRPQSLYGVASLIAQEMKVINRLHNALHADLKTPLAQERQP
mgnify:CR=1 FL=1